MEHGPASNCLSKISSISRFKCMHDAPNQNGLVNSSKTMHSELIDLDKSQLISVLFHFSIYFEYVANE